MWNWVVSAVLAIVGICICYSVSLSAQSDFDPEWCGENFARGNPNGTGGWILLSKEPNPLLCLSGNLADIELSKLLDAISAVPRVDVMVRSTGGAVKIWLPLGEKLQGRLNRLYVDDACFSSCANYIVPVATEVMASENSLIVWHGGPNPQTLGPLEDAGIPDVITYAQLSERTASLYDKVGVDIKVLAVTSSAPSWERMEHVVQPDDLQKPLSGYALSPERLSKCFGFKNLDKMWHAGNDEAVYALGKKRSEQLVLLESPYGDDSICF